VTLRRDGAFDLALPFLGVALLGFRDFSLERVDMVLGRTIEDPDRVAAFFGVSVGIGHFGSQQTIRLHANLV